jgi:hypothetical protein
VNEEREREREKERARYVNGFNGFGLTELTGPVASKFLTHKDNFFNKNDISKLLGPYST